MGGRARPRAGRAGGPGGTPFAWNAASLCAGEASGPSGGGRAGAGAWRKACGRGAGDDSSRLGEASSPRMDPGGLSGGPGQGPCARGRVFSLREGGGDRRGGEVRCGTGRSARGALGGGVQGAWFRGGPEGRTEAGRRKGFQDGSSPGREDGGKTEGPGKSSFTPTGFQEGSAQEGGYAVSPGILSPFQAKGLAGAGTVSPGVALGGGLPGKGSLEGERKGGMEETGGEGPGPGGDGSSAAILTGKERK